jgi:hypothetical protein
MMCHLLMVLPFTYTGGGLYVAFEYARAAGALPIIPNTALCTRGDSIIKGSFGQDSLRYVLSLGANKQDSLPGILPSASYRPETRFGSSSMRTVLRLLRYMHWVIMRSLLEIPLLFQR